MLDLRAWSAQQKSLHTPQRRIALLWRPDTESWCCATPYWPHFVSCIKPFGRWRKPDGVWELTISENINQLLRQIKSKHMNYAQDYRLMFSHVPVELKLGGLDYFSRATLDALRPFTSEASRALWGALRVPTLSTMVTLHPGIEIECDDDDVTFTESGAASSCYIPLYCDDADPIEVLRMVDTSLRPMLELGEDHSGDVAARRPTRRLPVAVPEPAPVSASLPLVQGSSRVRRNR